MSVDERIAELETRCSQLQKNVRFQGIAIMIVGICTIVLAVTG